MRNAALDAVWVPIVEKTDGPMYLTIAEAIARDIRAGILKPGQRLPSQRALADTLGIDFTTVSRAYAAAGRGDLVEGRVGQGTYIKGLEPIHSIRTSSAKHHSVDMSMNTPPQFDDVGLINQMWDGFNTLRSDHGMDFLMRHQTPGGSQIDRLAAQSWLQDHFNLDQAEDVIICNGVQGATWSILSLIAKPGDTICCEELTYPGFLAIARYLDLKVVPVSMDKEGLDPDVFAEICKKTKPKALYTTPTLHNPTTITMSAERRQKIADIARQNDLQIIEDDAYGVLATSAPPPIAYFAPDLTWYVSSLSKCLAPSLRVCFVVSPIGLSTEGVKRSIRANGSMVSAISASLTTDWITSGLAKKITAAIRAETLCRQDDFSKWVPDIELRKDAFHVWLPLPEGRSATEFVLNLRGVDIGLVPGAAFASGKAPNAVRIGLGSTHSRARFQVALCNLADALNNPDANSWMVV